MAAVARKYHFITRIEMTAEPERIWKVLARSESWIGWWRWLRSVEVIDEGGDDGTGHRVRHVVGSPLRYRLGYVGRVTNATEPFMSRFEAEGDLKGQGLFTLEHTNHGSTLLVFHWLVETPKPWMNLLAPLARPVFVWSHHRLMEDFAEDLADAVSADLIDVRNTSLRPRDLGFFEMPAFRA